MAIDGNLIFLLSGVFLWFSGSAYVLLRCAEHDVSWPSFLTSVMGFTLSFSIVGLVPYDVWEALAQAEGHAPAQPWSSGAPPEQLHMLVNESWAAIYWTTTVVCYLVIPFLIEFEAAGEFSFVARLKTSLRRNVAWYIAYAVIGTCAVAWLLVNSLEFSNLGAWCIAASNTWGLVLLTVLMGFGLVALPRQLWSLGNPSEQLRKLYPLATLRDEARKSAQYELQDAVSEARKEVDAHSLFLTNTEEDEDPSVKRAYCELQLTLDKCEALRRHLAGGGRGLHSAEEEKSEAASAVASSSTAMKPQVVGLPNSHARGGSGNGCVASIRNLENLHSSLKQARLEARRAASRWDDLVQQCLLYEELEDERCQSAVEVLGSMEESGCCQCCRRVLCRCHLLRTCWRQWSSIWVRKWRSRALRAASYTCGFLSAVIVLGQLTILNKDGFTLSFLSLFFHSDYGFVFTQVLCFLPLSYMACTAYWSVLHLKMAGWYGLYSNHNTDACSMLWCSYAVARLAMPLCYHFLLQIDVPAHLNTSFQEFMGQMNTVPLFGLPINQVFPCLVAFLVLCNWLKVYSRVVQCLGLSFLEFEWAPAYDSDDPHAEGKELIERERRRRAEESAFELQRRSESGGMDGVVPLRRTSGS